MAGWLLFVATANSFAQAESIQDTIRTRIEQVRDNTLLEVSEAPLASRTLLSEIYERGHFKAIWTNPDTIRAYIIKVEQIGAHGLTPSDYHGAQLRQLYNTVLNEVDNPWVSTDLELLLTDSLIRLLYHLYYGKVNPISLHPEWNFNRSLIKSDPAQTIREAIRTDRVCHLVDTLIPCHAYYKRVQAALAEYEAIQAKDGWPAIPTGPTLVLGERDQRVRLLRQRLAITGDLAEIHRNDSPVFDEPVKQALVRFQQRQTLEPDGVVDRITLDELNRPVEDRIDQVKANVERARWVLHNLPDRFVIIDICGYMAYFFDSGEIAWSTRIQVGQPYRPTPTFKSAIKYMVLNPTWTIPPGILETDYISKRDQISSYLKKRGIKVYDQNGRQIDPDTVDLKHYNVHSLTYRFVKEPGPDNPMGRIKFIFPNRHFVFLHDTNDKEAFNEDWRAFSSGCIRVENPLALAAILLSKGSQWDLKALQHSVSSGRTKTIHLPQSVPVMLLYMTVFVDKTGKVFFREDVYGRDRDIIDGLAQPFDFNIKR